MLEKSNNFNDSNSEVLGYKGCKNDKVSVKQSSTYLDYTFYGFYKNEEKSNVCVQICPCVKINDKYYGCHGLDLIELDLKKVTISKEIAKSDIEKIMKDISLQYAISIKSIPLYHIFDCLYIVALYSIKNLCNKLYEKYNKMFDLDYLKTCFSNLRVGYYKSPWGAYLKDESPYIIEHFVKVCFKFYYRMVSIIESNLSEIDITINIGKYLLEPLELFMKEFDYKDCSDRFPWCSFVLKTDESMYTKLYVSLEDGDPVRIVYKNGKVFHINRTFNDRCHYVCTGFVKNKVVD